MVDLGGYKRRECGEDSPPQDASGQDATGAEAISEVTADCLKQSIAGNQRAEHLAKLHIGQMVSINDRTTGDRDIDSVKVRNRAQDKQPEDQKPPHPGWFGRNHRSRESNYAACSLSNCESRSATILSSPG